MREPALSLRDGFDELASTAEPAKRYVPTATAILKTAAAMGIRSVGIDSKRRVVPIKRPASVEQARYDLPVSAMEFEIMDAIRNYDVTIICGETGSGKVRECVLKAWILALPRLNEFSFL